MSGLLEYFENEIKIFIWKKNGLAKAKYEMSKAKKVSHITT